MIPKFAQLAAPKHTHPSGPPTLGLALNTMWPLVLENRGGFSLDVTLTDPTNKVSICTDPSVLSTRLLLRLLPKTNDWFLGVPIRPCPSRSLLTVISMSSSQTANAALGSIVLMPALLLPTYNVSASCVSPCT